MSMLLLLCVSQFGLPQNRANSSAVQDSTIKVDVDLVIINATVTDREDHAVAGLEPTSFRIWEDKVQQQIAYVSAEDVPASLGIVLDISGSMQDKISAARAAAVAFLKDGISEDEYFLVEFNGHPRVAQDFTRNISQLRNRLTSGRAHGMTAMYDAVYLSLEKLKAGRNPKKALLLITDGDDNQSRYKVSELAEFLKEGDVQIYAIGIAHDNSELSRGGSDRAAIEELTELSGGGAFFPDSVQELEEICTKIALELKTQYVIGYKSTNLTKDGKWRKIHLELDRHKRRHHLTVRSKSGYYAPVDKHLRPKISYRSRAVRRT